MILYALSFNSVVEPLLTAGASSLRCILQSRGLCLYLHSFVNSRVGPYCNSVLGLTNREKPGVKKLKYRKGLGRISALMLKMFKTQRWPLDWVVVNIKERVVWEAHLCYILAMLLFNKLNFFCLLFKENSWKIYAPQSTRLFLPQGICLKFCFHSLSQYLSVSPLKMIFPDYCIKDTLLSLPIALFHGCFFFCHSQQYDRYLSVYFLPFFLESKLHTESTVQHIEGKKISCSVNQ